jgi:molybdopterin-containing oxidoreductase family iron-sulfur binding subunit
MQKEGREVVDGEFQTACSNACSTGAMVFGDVNDKEVNYKISWMIECIIC